MVAGGRVFLTTSEDAGNQTQVLQLVCFNAETGKTVWNEEVFEQRGRVEIHGKNSHASPTPLIDQDHVFVHFGPQGTACYTTNGDLVWKQSDLVYRPQHGNGGSPALVDDLLIICCDGDRPAVVAALDRERGCGLEDQPQYEPTSRIFIQHAAVD